MRAYVGQTRSRKIQAKLDRWDIGECTCRGELPPKRKPWFYDNGAYRDWKSGQPFDSEAFRADIARMRREALGPDFLVAPDILGGGAVSLEASLGWLPELAGFRVFLAVQDGMEPDEIAKHLHRFEGIFVGGTTEWKLETAVKWVDLAHAHGKPCHVGRVGKVRTKTRRARLTVEWAQGIGADSIDSSEPLWSDSKLMAWAGRIQSKQTSLWL